MLLKTKILPETPVSGRSVLLQKMNNILKDREGITKGCGLQSFEKEGEQGRSASHGSEHLPGRKEGLSHPTGTLDETHSSPGPPHHPSEEGTTKAKGWKENQTPLEHS